MTFKIRLWNTIALTILIFLVRLHSAPLLKDLDSLTIQIYKLSLLVVFIPFVLFIIQLTLHYLLKKDYPVQDRKIRHPILRIVGWITILLSTFLVCFLDYLGDKQGLTYVILSLGVSLGLLYVMPLYWLWIIKELKDNYGIKMGLGSFFLILFGFLSILSF